MCYHGNRRVGEAGRKCGEKVLLRKLCKVVEWGIEVSGFEDDSVFVREDV